MTSQFQRSAMLLGEQSIETLRNKHVAVFGIGGVGGILAETLVRTGIGTITIIDKDKVDLTNLNRQILALHSTIGKWKVDVMKDRLADINPMCQIIVRNEFFLPENSHTFPFENYDYVVDAVDTLSAKIEIVLKAKAFNIPVIASMGMGNKLNPEKIKVEDIHKTTVCPLAKAMRKAMRNNQVDRLKVVYSTEDPIPLVATASVSFVPNVAGLIMAGEVIKDLINPLNINQ